MTRLFGKKNKQTTIAELEEYYANQNQKKNRPWKAWLMAILSLLITVAVIVALFYGGRWLYRTFVEQDNSTSTTTSETNNNGIDLPSFDGEFGQNGNETTDGNVNGESDQPQNGDSSSNTESQDGIVSDEAATTTESNADRLANSGGSEEDLPETGAGEILVILPVSIAILGYIAAIKRQTRQ
jgi:cytoskeletal protein RodZ